MPFNNKTVMEQRLELVIQAAHPGANISELSKRYGISRRICYKWLKRYRQYGQEGLTDQSRRPVTSPLQTSPVIEQQVITLRKQNPEWGARKLRAILQREGYNPLPSASTIGTILLRSGLIKLERSKLSAQAKRFEYEHPNQLWQMDFKGSIELLDKSSCHPLTITDDHSRFNLCLAACANQRHATVKDQLISIFRRYGMPETILTDNGSPWGVTGNQTQDGLVPLSALEVWLLRLGIKVIHGKPYHPQTQGKEERFHRTLKTELLQYEQFRDLRHCQQRFDKWRDKYNLYRPHQAIGFKVPAERYTHSPKAFPEVLSNLEYGPFDIVRKVCDKGLISLKGKTFKLGKGLSGQWIAARATAQPNIMEIYFCNRKIKDIFINK
jgi:transposase InsO family protein